MLDFDNLNVSRCPDHKSPDTVEIKSLTQIVDEIRNPTQKTLDAVEELRTQPDEARVKELKGKLPLVLFSGCFTRRAIAGFRPETSTRLVIVDFDSYKDSTNTLTGEALKERLKQDPHVAIAFLSPRGGVKAAYLVDKLENDQDFKDAWQALKAVHLLKADKSGTDISRACYLSHDPDVYVNPMATPFVVTKALTPTVDIFSDPAPDEMKNPGLGGVESTPQTEAVKPTSATRDQALKHIRNTVAMIDKLKAVDPQTERHPIMLKACITAKGYVLGGHLTDQDALDEILKEYGRIFNGDRERLKDARRAYEGLASKVGGLDIKPLHPDDKGAPKDEKAPRTADDVHESRITEMYDLVFMPNWDNEPEYVEPVFRFKGEELGGVGSILAVQAEEKAGKSTLCLAMWSAYYLSNPELDTLGITVTPPPDRPLCIYFDTEQSNRQSHAAWSRALKRVGVSRDNTPMEIENTYLNTEMIADNIDRQAFLFHFVEQYADHIGAIILDGVTDFINEPNDARESNLFINKLRQLATSRSICVVVTIHKTPASDKMRGHLGSELARRAQSVLSLTKDRKNGIHEGKITRNRTGADWVAHNFKYDEELGRHVSVTSAVAQAAIWTEDVRKILEPFQGQTVSTKQITDRMTALDPKLEQSTARRRVTAWAKPNGVLSQRKRGVYYVHTFGTTSGDAEQSDDELF